MLYPKKLNKGDTIGICAPASPIKQKLFKKGLRFLKSLGFHLLLSENIRAKNGYLAGTEEQRLNDFHQLLKNELVKGIIFARGGFGCSKFAMDIDYELVKQNPKVIWGFSDITFLHLALYQKANLITFHGPMVMTAGRQEFDSVSKQGFQQLFKATTLVYNESISSLMTICEGKVTAPIIGGNLSLITSTLGTPFEINVKGKILFIEDLNEKMYKIDAMLNQLKLANKFAEVAGIVIGDFSHIKMHASDDDKHTSLQQHEIEKQLLQLFYAYFASLKIPVLYGFKIGHCFPHFAIPHGSIATLSTDDKTLKLLPGVTE